MLGRRVKKFLRPLRKGDDIQVETDFKITNRPGTKEKSGANMTHRSCAIEIAPRALLLAVSVLLSVLLVSLMISQFISAREMANISSEYISDRTEEIKNSDIVKLDGLTVSGADVVNFCLKNLENTYSGEEADIKIVLNGTSGNSRTYKNYEAALKLRDPENSEYVNPVTKWICHVKRNKNGIITEVEFTKK